MPDCSAAWNAATWPLECIFEITIVKSNTALKPDLSRFAEEDVKG